MSTTAFEAFGEKFRVESLAVRRYRHWTWSVRPVQGTLGASVISLNRAAASWSEVRSDENAELAEVVHDIESALRSHFAFAKINYLMLMMVDEHVHFHVFPRYPEARSFAGKEWVDATWPKLPDVLGGDSDPETVRAILELLKTA